MEQLILELNSPANQSSPERVRYLEKEIQRLQRENSAWQLGLDLLHNEQAVVRFYGALTLTTKINAHWSEDGLSEDESLRNHLLENLINEFIYLAKLPDALFVIRKISSTISAFFLKASSSWKLPVRLVLSSFRQGRYTAEDVFEHTPLFALSFTQLNYHEQRAVLFFCYDLVDTTNVIDSSSIKGAEIASTLKENGEDVWKLISICLGTALKAIYPVSISQESSLTREQLIDIVKLALQLVPLWTPYAPSNSTNEEEGEPRINSAFDQVMLLTVDCFHDAELTEAVLQVLTSLLRTYPRGMQKFQAQYGNAIPSLLKSQRALQIQAMLAGGDPESEDIVYLELLDSLVSQECSLEQPLQSKTLLDILFQVQGLTKAPGVAVLEDQVCVPLLEIFRQVLDAASELELPSQKENIEGLIPNVCQWIIKKSQYPVEELTISTASWDTDDRGKFHEFRQDAKDFLQGAFSLEGHPIVEYAAARAIQASFQADWAAFEAGLFSLNAILDSGLAEVADFDPLISQVFGTQMWDNTVQSGSRSPDKARKSAIDFVALNTGYFRRHPEAIGPSLNFLFSSLQLQNSATAAARAIYVLCDAHRLRFVEVLPQFIASLKDVSVIGSSDRNRVYSSVAAVVQAVPSEPDKVAPLSQILDTLSAFATKEHHMVDAEDLLAQAVEVLQALASVGKGLRAPVDSVIDLDASTDEMASFWTSGKGHHIQQRVLLICTNALRIPGANSNNDLVEAACNLVKSGYPEQHPSPFKFSAGLSVDFLSSQISLSNPNIEAVMACASAFLASASIDELSPLFDGLMAPLIGTYEISFATYQITKEVPDSSFSSSTIDFFTRLLPKWAQVWLSLPNSQQHLAIVIEVSLVVLSDQDTLPRRSAASLFAAIFDLSGPASSLSSPASSNFGTVLHTYSSRILYLLLNLIAGECARSELDAISEPLKKCMQKQGPQIRTLIREAMKEEAGVLSANALSGTSIEERMRFVAQIEMLRGAGKTTKVVREFWIDCRGSGFGYTT